MEKNQEKTKQTFANAWKKAADFGKKAAESAKNIVDQTKETIHEQQAKKYAVITKNDFADPTFQRPNIIKIEDDSANRNFVSDPDAIGWIEKHKEIDVLHIYFTFAKDCGIIFVPLFQRENVYCQDNFDSNKYINSNHVFGKATEEKLAELNNIAYCLGAKSCAIEIIEADTEINSHQATLKIKGSPASAETNSTRKNNQSGKTISYFEGHNDPKLPMLKWFAHDDNIKGLIEMRCNKAIKSNILELKGSSSATMSKAIACAIDDILKIGGGISMEKQALKEHSNRLLFEIEF